MNLKSFIAIALIAGAAAPASALTPSEVKKCNAMAASFTAKKGEIQKAKEALEAKAATTEEAGERWEAAEEMKLFSAKNAKIAADAKAEWEQHKSEFLKERMVLQSKLEMLNNDVSAFNRSCATE